MFQCRLCGECCSGDMKVFVNPEDQRLMVKALQLNSKDELFEQKILIFDERNGTVLPRIKFKSYGGVKFCPFLENHVEENGTLKGLCTLHPHFKPLVCHLAPLTRTVDFETDEETFGFIPPHPDCPGCILLTSDDQREYDFQNLSDDLKKRLEQEKAYFRTLWLAPHR